MDEHVSLYHRLLSAGCELDHHESDLYVRDSEAARALLRDSLVSRKLFCDKDGKHWWDVPFMYEPWWEKRGMK